MKKLQGLLLALATVVSLPAIAASPGEFKALANAIERVKNTTGYQTGTAVAVVKDGKVIYEGYFGYADIGARRLVDRDTSFYIASTTKPFLALHALLQERAGELDTGTTLQAMFPDTGFAGIDARAVTIQDLLTHTSGIDNQPLVWATAFSGLHDANARAQLVAASYANATAPRGTFDYSNVGYNIVSVWLDRKFAQPWQDQLAATVFAPLGMTRTSAYISEAKAKNWPLAKPYSAMSTSRHVPLYLEKADATMHAAGGLVSTAPDLARFVIAQLGDGTLDGRQVFPEGVIAQSHAVQATTDDEYLDFKRSGYAWGWYAGAYKGRRMLHHFGAFAGFHAHLSFIPEANVGLVVLNNEDFLSARLTSLIADQVYGTLLHEPDIQATSAARFDALLEKAMGLPEMAAKQRATIDGRAWQLSRPRQAYAGTYTHPLLGDISVALDAAGAMVLRWGRLAATATAYERADHVRVEFAPNSGDVLAFVVREDRVDALAFEGMTFKKIR